MWLIRAFEEKASELYAQGRIAGLLHLGIGQEGERRRGHRAARARATGVFGGHRAHAHALAKGADPARLLAELAGRTTGYCGGKGGSMHIAAPEVGFVTATGIVAGNMPARAGRRAGLRRSSGVGPASRRRSSATAPGQTGSFHESLNIASLWRLPVVFVCENNGYAEFTPLSAHTKVERLARPRRRRTASRPSTVDGNDVFAVRAAVGEAVARARAGDGPTFVEALTYRLRGHYEGDPAQVPRAVRARRVEGARTRSRGSRPRWRRGGLDDAARPRASRPARGRAIEAAAAEALAGPMPGPADLLPRRRARRDAR